MKTKTKALALFLSAVLLVVTTVFATMAYLTSQDEVKNTFTVGKVKITLDETDVDLYGVKDSETRVKENEYKLIPGHEYTKDPIVHVDAQSEDCWLFVELTNTLTDIIAGNNTFAETDDEDTVYTIEAQMMKNGWTRVMGTENIWWHKDIANANDDVDVFESFTLKGDAVLYGENETPKYDANTPITITAYAVQADGFNDNQKTAAENATAAWVAAFGTN